jgi:tetratricopeptide (TPR) repeat protein
VNIRATAVRLTVLLTLTVFCCGCQHFNSQSMWRLPWQKQTAQRAPTPLDSAAEHKPITDEQKADMQIVFAGGMERQGRYEEAREMYLKAVESDPERADGYHRLALLHDQQGQCQSAARYYQEAVQRDRDNPDLHCDIGYSCYLQERWPEAETSLRRAIALAPDLRRAHNNLGLVLARTGREREAFQEFARAGCDRAQAHANLAHALLLSNRWEEAEIEFRRALESNPKLVPARDGLASLQSLLAKQQPRGPQFNQPATGQPATLATHHEPLPVPQTQ